MVTLFGILHRGIIGPFGDSRGSARRWRFVRHRIFIACLKPSPTSPPRRLASGMIRSYQISFPQFRWRAYRVCFPFSGTETGCATFHDECGGIIFSAGLACTANNNSHIPDLPWVIQHFVPLMTHLFPSLKAVVSCYPHRFRYWPPSIPLHRYVRQWPAWQIFLLLLFIAKSEYMAGAMNYGPPGTIRQNRIPSLFPV